MNHFFGGEKKRSHKKALRRDAEDIRGTKNKNKKLGFERCEHQSTQQNKVKRELRPRPPPKKKKKEYISGSYGTYIRTSLTQHETTYGIYEVRTYICFAQKILRILREIFWYLVPHSSPSPPLLPSPHQHALIRRPTYSAHQHRSIRNVLLVCLGIYQV